MPLDVVISPEAEVARVAISRLASTSAFDTHTFLDGRAQLIGLKLEQDCPVLNTPLRQLSELFSTLAAIVVAIRRGDALLAPTPNDQLYAGDAVYLLAAEQDVQRAISIFGREGRPARRIVIIGAGNVGLTVAELLEADPRGIRATIIERDRERAEFAADRLSRTVVLNGDALEPEILDEAGIVDADAVLALTDDDKTNLLACALSKQAGCGLTIALTNDAVFSNLAGALGVDRPDSELLVSPEHRLLIKGNVARALFNTPEVLVMARDLVNDHSVTIDQAMREVTYIHLLLPRHQIVWANGVETESFHPASAALSTLDDGDRKRLLAFNAAFEVEPNLYGAYARRCLNGPEAALLAHEAA